MLLILGSQINTLLFHCLLPCLCSSHLLICLFSCNYDLCILQELLALLWMLSSVTQHCCCSAVFEDLTHTPFFLRKTAILSYLQDIRNSQLQNCMRSFIFKAICVGFFVFLFLVWSVFICKVTLLSVSSLQYHLAFWFRFWSQNFRYVVSTVFMARIEIMRWNDSSEKEYDLIWKWPTKTFLNDL